MRRLFLDDERMPADVTWIDIGPGPWEIVRSYAEAVAWVEQNGFPDVISFDHDLGYEAFDTNEAGIIVVTDSRETPSGHDFAKWLIHRDMDCEGVDGLRDDFRFTVHSMNPVGARNIRELLVSYLSF